MFPVWIRPRYLAEIVGLVLILLASGWQIFVEDTIRDIALDVTHGRLEEETGIIWRFLGELSRADYFEDLELRERYFELDQEFLGAHSSYRSRVYQQVEALTIFRGALFLIGSLLLVLGRHLELRHQAIHNNVARQSEEKV